MMLLCSFSFYAQDYFPKNDGVKAKNTNYTAFTNAKIYISPTQIINQGTLLIQNGKVIATGTAVNIPKNAVVIDVSGKYIYPSFIDMYSSFGVEKPKRRPNNSRTPQYDASRTGYYWNDHVMPENKAIERFKFDAKAAKDLLKAGFGTVNTHIHDGIVRGTGTLVALNETDGNETRILDANSAQYFSGRKSVTSRQVYPSSLMGSLALLRQMYLDANWYAKGLSKTKDLSLEALNRNKNLVQIFEAGSRANVLRADKVGDAHGVQYIMLGGGDEYERINDIKATNAAFIIPVNFPEAFDVEDSFLASTLSLGDMRAWNQKPANPKVLAENNITFALTTHGLKSPTEFKAQL